MSPSPVVDAAMRAWSTVSTRRLRRRLAKDPVGFNFFGSVSGNLGLGEAARHTLTLLRSQDHPVLVTDIDPGNGRGGKVLTHCHPGERSADKGRHLINLFHLNPPEALGFLWGHPEIAARDRVNVCVPYWELEDLPENRVEFMRGMDVIFAPTDFIGSAIEKALPETRCILLPQGVERRDSAPDRLKWGLPVDAVVFLATFDLLSDYARKNPAGVIRAFRAAFPDRDDVRLVLKTQPVPRGLSANREELHTLVIGDARISLIEAGLTVEELTALNAAADAYVSLHRSEGLGLGLMESLSLGVPVIATAYSGPMDFLSPENSLLVPYTLIPVDSANPTYAPMNGVSRWAEPDIREAAAAMRSLADDPALRRRLGDQGRVDMEARRRTVAEGVAIRRLVQDLRTDDELWIRHPERNLTFKTFAPSRLPSPGVMRHRIAVQVKRRLRIEV